MENAQIVAVLQAYTAGQVVEFRVLGAEEWIELPALFNLWNFEDFEYRVKPLDHDEFDWSAASPGFKWLARDLDGQAYLSIGRPERGVDKWSYGIGAVKVSARYFSSYAPGPRGWKESLQERPE